MGLKFSQSFVITRNYGFILNYVLSKSIFWQADGADW